MDDEHKGQGAESPFMQDGEGHWILNPKSRVTGVELMAVQFMQQSQAKGEPADPITAMTRAAETWKTLREGLGIGAAATPTWQTDPAEFIKTVKAITGDSGGDSALKETLTKMQESMDEMKEQRYRDQFAGQQKQIQEVTNVLNRTIDTISDMQKGSVGRTEMDIIHEVVIGGKEELSGLRKDVREAFVSSSLPPGKTAEERELRKQQTRKALKIDQEIEEIGQRLFFPQE